MQKLQANAELAQHRVTESPRSIAGGLFSGTTINFYFLTSYLRGETYEELHGV